MRDLFLNHIGQTSHNPIMLEVNHAEGIYIYDCYGNRFADMTSGICVSSLGHSHPAIIDAIKQQADKYLHTMVYGEHIQSPQVRLATKLTKHLPESLDSVHFTNSGSEATEGAIKLVRKVQGKAEIIACRNGYHGSTIGAMSLMSNPALSLAYQPSLPGIRFIDFNNLDQLSTITESTAAVILEPVRGPAGVEIPDEGYLAGVRARCNETGALLIFDEIQCGMGRTGTMFAFEQYESVPDILLLAKALGGGMPLGAIIAGKKLLDRFAYDPPFGYISTFGGHPVCCAAALAGLQILEENPSLLDDVITKSELIRSRLKTSHIKEVRSAGLLIAVEVGSSEKVEDIIDLSRARGVLVDHFLFCSTAFRIAPPLTITEKEIEKYIGVINEVIEDTH